MGGISGQPENPPGYGTALTPSPKRTLCTLLKMMTILDDPLVGPNAGQLFFLHLIKYSSYMTHCRSRNQLRAAVFNVTKSPLELCSGHSLAMCCAFWSVAPPSYYADGESPIWFMLYINLPYPVLIRFRRMSECHAR